MRGLKLVSIYLVHIHVYCLLIANTNGAAFNATSYNVQQWQQHRYSNSVTTRRPVGSFNQSWNASNQQQWQRNNQTAGSGNNYNWLRPPQTPQFPRKNNTNNNQQWYGFGAGGAPINYKPTPQYNRPAWNSGVINTTPRQNNSYNNAWNSWQRTAQSNGTPAFNSNNIRLIQPSIPGFAANTSSWNRVPTTTRQPIHSNWLPNKTVQTVSNNTGFNPVGGTHINSGWKMPDKNSAQNTHLPGGIGWIGGSDNIATATGNVAPLSPQPGSALSPQPGSALSPQPGSATKNAGTPLAPLGGGSGNVDWNAAGSGFKPANNNIATSGGVPLAPLQSNTYNQADLSYGGGNNGGAAHSRNAGGANPYANLFMI